MQAEMEGDVYTGCSALLVGNLLSQAPSSMFSPVCCHFKRQSALTIPRLTDEEMETQRGQSSLPVEVGSPKARC